VHEADSFKELACKWMTRGFEQSGRRPLQNQFFLRDDERLDTTWEFIEDRNRVVVW